MLQLYIFMLQLQLVQKKKDKSFGLITKKHDWKSPNLPSKIYIAPPEWIMNYDTYRCERIREQKRQLFFHFL